MFTGNDDGGNPMGYLIEDHAGNLYGTAETEGSYGDGVVFKLSPDGKESVLHAFRGGRGGNYPVAGLLLGKKHNLYSTTQSGGANNYGTIFEVRE